MSSTDKAQHGGSIPIDPHDLKMVTAGSSPVALAHDKIFASSRTTSPLR